MMACTMPRHIQHTTPSLQCLFVKSIFFFFFSSSHCLFVTNLSSDNEDIEEQELNDKLSKITNQISSKIGINHTNEDAQDEKRELNYEAIIDTKLTVSL